MSPHHQPRRPLRGVDGLRPGQRWPAGLFGGYNGSAGYNDTWTWNDNTNTWSQLTPPQPRRPLRGVDGLRPGQRWSAGLFGGNYNGIGYFSDTGTERATWAMLSPPPAPPAVTRTPWRTTCHQSDGLFGGYEGGSYYNDTWIIGAPPSPPSAGIGPTTGSSVTITVRVCRGGGHRRVMFGTTAATAT